MWARVAAWPLEKLCTLLTLTLFSCALIGHVGRSSLFAMLWGVAVIPALFFSLRSPLAVARVYFLREPFLLAFLALALGSYGWSLLPEVTLLRALKMLATYQVAVYLAARYSWPELLSLCRWALRLSLLLSLAFALARPGLGFHVGLHQGLFRGLFGHKNFAARIGSLLTSLALAAWASGLSRRSGLVLVSFDLLLGLLVLKLSGSRTALLVLVGVFLCLSAVTLLGRANRSLRLALSALVLAGAGFLLPLLPLLFGLFLSLNWNTLLTGRVNMWGTVLYFVVRRPWTGFGYGAFFDKSTYGGLVTLFEGWDVPHAHNIVLELVADLGIGGGVVYLGSLAFYHARALRAPAYLLQGALVVSTFNILTGLTEIVCFPSTEIASLLYMYFALTLSEKALPLGRAPLAGQKPLPEQSLHGQQPQEQRIGGQIAPP